MAGIYIHIPFCKKACHYCNFFFTTSDRWYEDTVVAIKREIQLRSDYLKNQNISSIYFGGGTPSMLKPIDIQNIIDEIRITFNVDQNAEITLEANPDNLTSNYLKSLKSTEINRLSIGVQSFFDDDLVWMNRAHDAEESNNCIKMAQDQGYSNLTIDLIFGVPNTNLDSWQQNLERATELNIPHLSCYALTVEPKTALGVRVKKKLESGPDDTAQASMFYLTHDYLNLQGYEHYEISNYALPGHRAEHNSNYWKGVHYLGIGPSAHSFDGQSRSWNVANMKHYLDGIFTDSPSIEIENLSRADKFNEFLMISLRKIEGIDLPLLYHTFPEFISHFEKCLISIDSKLININNGNLTLSREGLIYADQVSSDLFFI